jgi:hypothetical protein
MMEKRGGRMPLAGQVAAAALVRVALWAATLACTGTRVIASGDTASYLEPGRNLLFHGQFQTAGLPEIGRTPGYPLFLAATSGGGLALASLIQVAVSVLCVYLVWRLGKAVFASERIALCAAWLFAFEPVSVVYSVRLLSETLFLAVFLLSMERLAVFLRGHDLRPLAAGGVLLAGAIFVRPAAYYLPFLLAIGLAAVCRRDAALRSKAPLVLLLATLPWLGAWQLRNFVETGFGGFSSVAVRNLYFYNAAEVAARDQQRSFEQVQQEFGYSDEATYLAIHPDQKEWNAAERLAWMRVEAERILRAHPAQALRTQAIGSAVVAFTPCAADLMRMLGAESVEQPARVVHTGALRAAAAVALASPWRALPMALFEAWLLTLYLFALRGTVRGGAPRAALALLLASAAYFLVVSGGVQAVGRYRLPLMPIVCLLAAAGMARRNGIHSGRVTRP